MHETQNKWEVGQLAPSFKALDQSGQQVSSEDFFGKYLLIYFYPKDDTPGCTTQACAFRDQFAELLAKNIQILGVSPDSAKSHLHFRQKYDLPFPLLVDSTHELAMLFGVWGEKQMAGKTYMGIVRSQFLIDPQGRFANVWYGIRPKDSLESVLQSV